MEELERSRKYQILHEAKCELLQKLEIILSDSLTNVLNNVGECTSMEKNNTESADERKDDKAEKNLADKKFVSRNSILTDLFEINHIRTIYHIFIAMLILLFITTTVNDFLDTGRLSLDFDLIFWTFGKLHIVIALWICMKLATICTYPAFYFWAISRIEFNSRLWDVSWLSLYIGYLCAFIYCPIKEILAHDLPPVSSFIILCEQVRLIMKVHAFVRTNIPRTIKITGIQDAKENICPDFSKFLYFLFAPTLIYRDEYPRTNSIRWHYVVSNLFQVAGCMFYTNFLFMRFCIPVFRQYGQKPFTAKYLVLSVFGCMLPGTLCLLCAFFAILHSWLNAFAEMLQFADRMFYRDWWNSTNYAIYYRTWNVVVHDWLYTYVYRDLCYLGIFQTKLVPMLFVFIVSAAFHEYILCFTFKFFYPLLMVLFGGFGVGFMFVRGNHRGWNVFMWLTLFFGTGLLMSLYSLEWYARINCTKTDGLLDMLVPRSWTCGTFSEHV